MAGAVNPTFVGTPQSKACKLTTANTNLDGTGSVVLLYTAGANGSRIDKVKIKAQGTTTAGVIRCFLYDGSLYHLYTEQLTAGATPSGTVAAEEFDLNLNLILASGWSVYFSTNNTENWQISTTQAGDF